jgi:hypothetical protein
MKIKNIKNSEQRDKEAYLERKAVERYLENYKLEKGYISIEFVGRITKQEFPFENISQYLYRLYHSNFKLKEYSLYGQRYREISVQTNINLSMKDGIKSKCYALKEDRCVIDVKEGNVRDANLSAKNLIINKRRRELEVLIDEKNNSEGKMEIVDLDDFGEDKK